MNNSHLDVNVSLGVNIVEGCMTANLSATNKMFGVDIKPNNFDSMLACSFRLANALRNLGVRGLYYKLAPLYIAYNRDKHEYVDAVRILHLLPKYANNHAEHGEWPIPLSIKDSKLRGQMMDWYANSHLSFDKPLSYVPELDKYWLGEDAIDVFSLLGDKLEDLLAESDLGFPWFQLPKKLTDMNFWLSSQIKNKRYYAPATVFLLCYFPYRMSSLIMQNGLTRVDWLWDALGAKDITGNIADVIDANHMTFMKYGPLAIRLWLKEEEGVLN